MKKLIPVLFLVLTACSNKKQVDLIIYNARIYTLDSDFTIKEAMAVNNGSIVAAGSTAEILSAYAATSQQDLEGKSVYPGFIDAHCHFLAYGLGLGRVNLVGTRSFDEVLQRTKTFSRQLQGDKARQPAGITSQNTEMQWLIGRGWDQNDWDKKEMPDKSRLDSLFPDQPVFLSRIDGHAALVNSAALKIAGISKKSAISGGEIVLKNNEPTGLLVDNAVELVRSKIPAAGNAQKEHALLNAEQNCLAMGLTTVDDAGLMKEDVELIDRLHREGKLKMRLYVMLSDSSVNYAHYLQKGPYRTDRLNVCSFKFYADGALGSRGACLLHAYADKKDWKGFLLSEQKHFEEYAVLLKQKGFQMNTHCIGDSAYRIILGAYRKAGVTAADRWRIEHAQVVDPADLETTDIVIPSVQPTHATSDMYWAQERLGQRVQYAYSYKDLLKKSGLVALGTDFPVEDISPFRTFFAAVQRQDSAFFPEGGFQPENSLSRVEALRGMTIWAAYSNFEEDRKGSLEPGKLADFVVLSEDLMECPAASILKARVLSTYINGEKVYSEKLTGN